MNESRRCGGSEHRFSSTCSCTNPTQLGRESRDGILRWLGAKSCPSSESCNPKDPARPTSSPFLYPHPKSLWWAPSSMNACTLPGFCFSLAVPEHAGGMCKHPLQHARKLEQEAHRASQASLGYRMRQFQNKNKRLSSDMHAQGPGFNLQHNEIQ